MSHYATIQVQYDVDADYTLTLDDGNTYRREAYGYFRCEGFELFATWEEVMWDGDDGDAVYWRDGYTVLFICTEGASPDPNTVAEAVRELEGRSQRSLPDNYDSGESCADDSAPVDTLSMGGRELPIYATTQNEEVYAWS